MVSILLSFLYLIDTKLGLDTWWEPWPCPGCAVQSIHQCIVTGYALPIWSSRNGVVPILITVKLAGRTGAVSWVNLTHKSVPDWGDKLDWSHVQGETGNDIQPVFTVLQRQWHHPSYLPGVVLLLVELGDLLQAQLDDLLAHCLLSHAIESRVSPGLLPRSASRRGLSAEIKSMFFIVLEPHFLIYFTRLSETDRKAKLIF